MCSFVSDILKQYQPAEHIPGNSQRIPTPFVQTALPLPAYLDPIPETPKNVATGAEIHTFEQNNVTMFFSTTLGIATCVYQLLS